MIEEDEEWGRVKMGRFSDVDERLVRRVMGPWFSRRVRACGSSVSLSSGKPCRQTPRDTQFGGIARRARVVSSGYNYKALRQAVVKVGHCPMTNRMVQKQVCYVARLRNCDRESGEYGTVPVWDGFGHSMPLEEALDITRTWDLMSDEENYSKKARELIASGDYDAFRALGSRQGLRNIQAWHFVFSVEEDGLDNNVSEKFRSAVRGTVDQAFTAKGHSVAWTIHKAHTGHLHAHVVVKSLSQLGGRIHSDIHGHYLHSLRETFARYLKYVGLEYEASRRVDRGPLRERIMAGYHPLNDNHPCWRHGGSVAPADPYADLPMWSAVFGDQAMEGLQQLEEAKARVLSAIQGLKGEKYIAAAANVLREHLDAVPEKPSWFRHQLDKVMGGLEAVEWPRNYRELFEVFHRTYHDPASALASWQRMSMDGAFRDKQGRISRPNRVLACWTLRHRPEMFGRVTAEAYGQFDDKWLKRLLRRAWMPRPHQMPLDEGMNNTFVEGRNLSRIQKDREKVIIEMKRLLTAIDTRLKNHWHMEDVIAELRKTSRIKIGQPLPKFCDADLASRSFHSETRPKPVKGAGGITHPLEDKENTDEINQHKQPLVDRITRRNKGQGR